LELPDIYNRLTTVLQEVFDDDDLVATPELSASDVEEWDSLKHIRLILSVEKAFNIRFSASDVGNLKNVGELATLIHSKV
jgi:acyl carrier protein